jgi:hypothetical protein
MTEEQLTKSELLTVIKTERASLESALAKFAEAQKSETLLENGWRVEDLMAHIAAWERVGYDIVQAARDGEPLKTYVSKVFESIDDFNAQAYEANKDKSLHEIEAKFQAAYQDFVVLIEPLDEAFIASNLPFEDAEGITVELIISSNTFHHYQEHATALEKLLSGSKSG